MGRPSGPFSVASVLQERAGLSPQAVAAGDQREPEGHRQPEAEARKGQRALSKRGQDRSAQRLGGLCELRLRAEDPASVRARLRLRGSLGGLRRLRRLDGGRLPGTPSAVVDLRPLADGRPARLLRPGADPEAVAAALAGAGAALDRDGS